MDSLWGEEFDLKEEDLQKILNKTKNKKVVKEVSLEKKLKSKNVSIEEKMELIEQDVYRILGKYKDDIVTIRDSVTFIDYINKAIENGIIAIDTETNNTLDTIDCKLMGLCLYTPGEKYAYIPVNHINKDTEQLLSNQLNEMEIGEQLQRLVDNNIKIVYTNASFDIEVLYSTCKVMLPVYWDTIPGSKLLDENEQAGLKAQYKLHIDPEEEKYDIEHLFKGLPYGIFKPELFAYYAALDPYKTYKLYEYQLKEFEKPENEEIYKLLMDIEIPIIPVVVKMELRGIEIDKDYAQKMSIEYHKKADEIQGRINEELDRLQPYIDEWKLSPDANMKQPNKKGDGYGKSKVEQLSDPIELGSPTQMAILLYDILQVPIVDKKKPRTTDAAALEILANEKHVKICELLLEKREVDILINSFIDKIPTFAKSDNSLHARFNPCGTVTGRFSSTDPNLQQIPSHDKFIRMIFKARSGYSIVGCDYSAQEPRSTAALGNDKDMIGAYERGEDLYARIGSICFKNNYENNLEFNPVTHVLQPEGKVRRSKAKVILLGITYGMGAQSLAEKLEMSLEEAQEIIDNFYKGFKGVDQLTKDSQKMLREKGYVTDMWGRRRHIPDAQLPEYEVKPNEKYKNNYEFNPLLGALPHEDKATQMKIKQYQDKLSKAKWKKEVDNITQQAFKEGFNVKNNKGFITRSLRQCLNARIQGTAASMTKLAMIMVDNDPELNKLGFHLAVTVHDEVFGTCKIENAEAASKRLSEVMIDAAKTKCSAVPWKCDPYIVVDGWLEDEAIAVVKNNYEKYIKSGMSENDALTKVVDDYKMLNPDSIALVCNSDYVIGRDSIKHGPRYYN